MTVLEVIQRSCEFLARKGVEAPRLQVEWLLAQVLNMPRLKLYLSFDRVLTQPELDQLRGLVQRRGQREPVQHILGTACFCGLDFGVDRRVLIPRPETELLAEAGWEFLGPLPEPTVLDFGTGSGCLAITLAVKCPRARIHALDLSDDALEVARANANRHAVAERIVWHHGDGLGALPPELQFDLVLANPPYIPTAELASLQPEVRNFDPRLALDGGPDGLAHYRRLAAELPGRLRRDGRWMAEFGDGQAPALRALLEAQNWIVERIQPDYAGRLRLLSARR